MQKIILFLFLFFNISIYSQTSFNSKELKVTRADLELNVYEKDSTANALVLYEYGKSYIDNNDYSLKTEEKRKIKILNREGFNKANVTIYLRKSDDRKEKVKNIIATTYNLVDGKVSATKLSDTHIFEEKYNDDFTLIKFTLPNIKEGSVINYSYTLQSPFKFNYQGWSFQSDIPKLYSEYNTSIPAHYEYHLKLAGLLKLDINDSAIESFCLQVNGGGHADCTISKYAMRDVPAFIEEDYMTTKDDYLAKITYELNTVKQFDGRIDKISKTWKDVDKELKTDSRIGKQLKVNISNDAFNGESDLLKRAENIYSHVQKTYTWNESFNLFGDNSVKDLMKNKSGNVAEINMLLHNLLKENDITVSPVLLSTRNNGFATKLFPIISEFNYLIVQVTINNESYLLDATDNYLSFGELPFRCLNQRGRLLDFKKGSSWIDITPKNISTIQYKIDLKLEDNNQLTGKMNQVATGYHALPLKEDYYSNKTEYVNKYKEKYADITFSNHEVTSKNKTSYKFIEGFDIAFATEEIGGNIYLNPFLFKLLEENPLKFCNKSITKSLYH